VVFEEENRQKNCIANSYCHCKMDMAKTFRFVRAGTVYCFLRVSRQTHNYVVFPSKIAFPGDATPRDLNHQLSTTYFSISITNIRHYTLPSIKSTPRLKLHPATMAVQTTRVRHHQGRLFSLARHCEHQHLSINYHNGWKSYPSVYMSPYPFNALCHISAC
jgi:hypothetical protein